MAELVTSSLQPIMKQIIFICPLEKTQIQMTDGKTRCEWVPISDPLYLKYHDEEWGTPLHDDRKLFELLILEGAQAGLSWKTILNKRENFREAFDGFDPEKVALYDDGKIAELLSNKGIIRNRLKINAAIANAKAFLEARDDYGSFDAFIWKFVDIEPVINTWNKIEDVPAKTGVSDMMSKELRKRGFKFAGSTICYSFMQATGMVNDHVVSCFRYSQINELSKR